MELGLEGKVVLISASTSGIGYGIAQVFLQEGAQVLVNGRSRKTVDAALEQLAKKGLTKNITAAPYDLTTKAGCESLFAAFPEIDILINNLGVYEEMPFDQISDEMWLEFFNVNILSGVRLSRFYLPKMIKKNSGRIVFISSEAALNVVPIAIHYAATKGAQLSLARGLAEMTKGSCVTVNSILPSITLTSGVKKFISDSMHEKNISYEQFQDEYFNTIKPTSLIKRFQTIEEIANSVAFVCSQWGACINGSALHIEGGVLRSI